MRTKVRLQQLARLGASLFTATLMTATVQSQAATERVGDFALLDEEGRFHQLSRYQHRDAVVMLTFDGSCSAAMDAAQELGGLQSQYGDSVEFLALDVSGATRSERNQWQLPFPVLGDEMMLVAESLGLRHAGEVLVFNPERMSLFYRGGAEAALGERLAAVIGGEASDTATADVNGCAIEYTDLARHKESPPDYSTEIAPIVVENCAICHRWGGAGPFPFDSYLSLLGWSPMVREVILNKRMPPMQVDPETGASANAHAISASERQKLLHWMEAGAPRGEGEVDPLELIPIEKEFDWQLGEPDFVVESPTNVVPAVGIQDYEYLEVELPFGEDKWVRAFQYSPGDERVLHHLMTFVVGPDEDFWGPEKSKKTAERRFLGSFIPGENPATVFPEGTGVLIPAGHKLALQFHYVTNGLQIRDNTSIGLYFSDAPAEKEILTRAVAERFTIAPGDPEHPIAAAYRFDEPVQLLAVRARMNYRGKHMKFAAAGANGKPEEIFSIPAYNYGWQPHYWLDEPVSISAGTEVKVTGAFDNSLSNPFNPDPREEVTWGLESWEEMFTGYLTYVVED
jgi:mono/diheme cytochrome c family protein